MGKWFFVFVLLLAGVLCRGQERGRPKCFCVGDWDDPPCCPYAVSGKRGRQKSSLFEEEKRGSEEDQERRRKLEEIRRLLGQLY